MKKIELRKNECKKTCKMKIIAICLLISLSVPKVLSVPSFPDNIPGVPIVTPNNPHIVPINPGNPYPVISPVNTVDPIEIPTKETRNRFDAIAVITALVC